MSKWDLRLAAVGADGRGADDAHGGTGRLEGRVDGGGGSARIGRQKVPAPTEADFRFTVGKGGLYAWGYRQPAKEARIVSLASGRAKVERVTMAGSNAPLSFLQTPEALVVTLPALPGGDARMPYGLKIEGSLPMGIA